MTPVRSKELKSVKPPAATRQLAFHQLLLAARNKWTLNALLQVAGRLDPSIVRQQIAKYVPVEAQQVLARAGLREEHVFPLPVVLEAKPSLVGYYRMLLGASQKSFYGSKTGLALFKSMEESDTLTDRHRAQLDVFCREMAIALRDLVVQMSVITAQDLEQLPLLTYGAQLQGSNNTAIGKQAIQEVFSAIAEIVSTFVVQKTPHALVLRNASDRDVAIRLSSDPDVSIRESFGVTEHANVAIEVKGGTDISNAHNRAGEAEKSHLKAKRKGYRDFWTIISKEGLNLEKLKQESPSTTEWFDVTQLLARKGSDWDAFRARIASATGIPLVKRRSRK